MLGVLWRVKPRDVAALNLYESIDSGLYRRDILPVQAHGYCKPALVYVGRTKGRGSPRPGYLELVLEAAREWELPTGYLRMLEYWSSSGWHGVRALEAGEIACPAFAM